MILDYDEFTKNVKQDNEQTYCNGELCDETPVIISEPEPTEAIPAIETPEGTVEPLPEPVTTPVEILPSEDGNIPGSAPCGCCGEEQGCCCNNESLTIGEFFGTLMESVQIAWRYHLNAKKHSQHVILEEYYDDAQDLIDTIIENYQGRYGIVSGFRNCICDCNKSEVEYFQELRSFLECKKIMFSEITSASELMSDIDALASKIDSTLYKLINLTESSNYFKTFDEFVNE